MSERGPTLRYEVHERPPLFIAAGLGLQNALFVISGAILLPILLRAADLITAGEAAFLVSASLLTAGLSTAVQAFRVGAVGSGFMLFMGTSGTFFAATFDAIELAGIGFVAALALIAAPTELLVARFFRFFRNIFTPTASDRPTVERRRDRPGGLARVHVDRRRGRLRDARDDRDGARALPSLVADRWTGSGLHRSRHHG